MGEHVVVTENVSVTVFTRGNTVRDHGKTPFIT